MILRIRHVTGGMIERQLAAHYTFHELVASIDAALDSATPLQLAVQPNGSAFVLDPDATTAIAVVED